VSTTLAELLEKLTVSAQTKTEKGSLFEVLVASYLRTAPEYADRFPEVHLWNEWPQREGQSDHGIDIVAWDRHTDGWCAIQCKFYDFDHRIAKSDVDSFIAASSRARYTSRLIFSTAKDWGATVQQQLDGLAIPVVTIGVSDMLQSKVEWSAIDPLRPPTVLPTSERNRLRPHQQAALNAVIKGYDEGNERGQLIMACGTGKTFTSLKIAERIAQDRQAATTVLFLVPSIQLLNQSLREWKQESQIPFRAFAVCSDIKVGRKAASEDLSARDLIIPPTTSGPGLIAGLAHHSDTTFTVIFSTYQSIDVVAQAQAAGLPDFDLIVCDEAHRTTGVTLTGTDESTFVRVHDNTYLRAARRLYMTATPRVFNDSTKEKAAEADAVLASMDDVSKYGPEFHRLGFGEAVEGDLLTDYQVLVLTVDEAYVSRNFQNLMADESGELKLDDAARIIGCWNGLAKKFADGILTNDPIPMRRAVAFARDIKTSKMTSMAFPSITGKHAELFGREYDTTSELRVEASHVDGTMNALVRNDLLQWLKDGADGNVCRILSNARCLSEGVDVPALDAVLFLTPRGSQIDVVQSVGRVMRKAAGKKVGYIILPIVIPTGVAPEVALNNNERYKVVWQVLQALRAHDDRFSAMVNKIDLNKMPPDKIKIFDGTPRPEGETTSPKQLGLDFDLGEWRDAIYAKIVDKVGERKYWQTWAADVAEIARQHIVRIAGLLADDTSRAAGEFATFLEGLRGNLNDGITADDAIEMLAQHLITRPVFDALFDGYDFAANNPVAQSMERMLAVLDEHSLDNENKSLEKFYESVRNRVSKLDNPEARQRVIVELYDGFFATAFTRTVQRLGIVYTPVEIVDFILNSAEHVLRHEFGQGLTDEGVHILDGFAGTGTFPVRLLQSGLIQPHDLARKYTSELHANEILLLAYYIAAVNIETTYHSLTGEHTPFPGLILTDTFQSWERDDRLDLDVFPENNDRLERLKRLPITVIVGNPPYSAAQRSQNDNNQNEQYPDLDRSIRETYAARSTATLKNKLYDSYIRAIRWASLRIKDRGVIAFVTNAGFLDGKVFDGLRLTLSSEFTSIYVLNLRGNARTAGEPRQREGESVFGGGSRASVAVTVLVKNPARSTPASIHYCDIGDRLSRKQKLARVSEFADIARLEPLQMISSNASGDWLRHRTGEFDKFLPIGDRSGAPAIFELGSLGVVTSRDAWVYNFSKAEVERTAASSIDFYNSEVRRFKQGQAASSPADLKAAAEERVDSDPTKMSWDRKTIAGVSKGRLLEYDPAGVRIATYRPFMRQNIYFDAQWNSSVSQLPRLFPTVATRNPALYVVGVGSAVPFSAIAIDCTPDLHVTGAGSGGQVFPRWTYDPADTEGVLQFEPIGEIDNGRRRTDNITDEALRKFQTAYGGSVTKDDIFFFVYGVLHSRYYRANYEADLKKQLPRIPLVDDPHPYVAAGRALADLHLGYESVVPYPLDGLDGPANDSDHYNVGQMAFGKPPNARRGAGEKYDRSTIVYNSKITLRGIPLDAYRYQIGSRSAIEWIMERYQLKTDKASGIVNDPNAWSSEHNQPRYILELLARIVTVSLETMRIVDALPALAIRVDQCAGPA
jgi:predicted helicase